MNGEQILEVVKPRIKDDWLAISIDGSAFDSSQFQELMEVVDDKFWKLMEPYIRDIIQHNWESWGVIPTVSVDTIVERLMKGLL